MFDEENDKTEDIAVTGIDLPKKTNCTQLDFDMLAMSQSILDYVKQQELKEEELKEALISGQKVPENPSKKKENYTSPT